VEAVPIFAGREDSLDLAVHAVFQTADILAVENAEDFHLQR